MRELWYSQKEIVEKLDKLEKMITKQNGKLKKHEEEIILVFNTLKKLLKPASKPREPIGYKRTGE